MGRLGWPECSQTKNIEADPPPGHEKIEGGYTALPNAVLRVWIPSLSGAETSVLMWLIQDTLSWHRQDSKPTTYRLIAKRANIHRHSVERAVAVLTGIGLIGVREPDESVGAYSQSFTINTALLQTPPMELDSLVQRLDHLRNTSKKGTAHTVLERDLSGPKNGPVLVQKKDPLKKEESKEAKETKKLAAIDSKGLEGEIWDRIERSRLTSLGGQPLDSRTVANISAQIERLPAIWQAKQVLEAMEAKCLELARRPHMAESWGLIVTVVRVAVAQLLARPDPSLTLADDGRQKPWAWMTTEERTVARAAERKGETFKSQVS
jgi:hypothetical protein